MEKKIKMGYGILKLKIVGGVMFCKKQKKLLSLFTSSDLWRFLLL